MPFYNYNNNIPFSTNNPSNDQPLMETNTNSINSIIGVDHFSFQNNNGGTHQQVQLLESGAGNGALPAGLQPGNFETIYSSLTNGNGELWFTRRQAAGIQLTGPGIPVQGNNGSTFLPGGIALKWGNLNPQNTKTVTFPVPFNAIYNISLTLAAPNFIDSTPPFAVYIDLGSIATTGFNIRGIFNAPSGAIVTEVYWIAIGS